MIMADQEYAYPRECPDRTKVVFPNGFHRPDGSYSFGPGGYLLFPDGSRRGLKEGGGLKSRSADTADSKNGYS
jgi:hypothetical protein